jgi:3-hydroxy-3-methylglutaryl CoA synthase
MDHVWDFYKPDLHSEYPTVDGPLSNECYITAVDKCYQGYMKKLRKLVRYFFFFCSPSILSIYLPFLFLSIYISLYFLCHV